MHWGLRLGCLLRARGALAGNRSSLNCWLCEVASTASRLRVNSESATRRGPELSRIPLLLRLHAERRLLRRPERAGVELLPAFCGVENQCSVSRDADATANDGAVAEIQREHMIVLQAHRIERFAGCRIVGFELPQPRRQTIQQVD